MNWSIYLKPIALFFKNHAASFVSHQCPKADLFISHRVKLFIIFLANCCLETDSLITFWYLFPNLSFIFVFKDDNCPVVVQGLITQLVLSKRIAMLDHFAAELEI